MAPLPHQRHDEIAEFLSFCDKQKRFVWKRNIGRARAGMLAGTVQQNGYRVIKFKKKCVLEHHLIWLFAHGIWPAQLDHIDGDRLNNELSNLREATTSQNLANSKLNAKNTSGFKGVRKRYGKFVALITKDYRQITIGRFDSAEKAHEAYMKIAKELFGQFARSA